MTIDGDPWADTAAGRWYVFVKGAWRAVPTGVHPIPQPADYPDGEKE